jgi:hypothetical protein
MAESKSAVALNAQNASVREIALAHFVIDSVTPHKGLN